MRFVPTKRRRRVALGNNKGGTGKTAVTVQLAAALSHRKLRVLVSDLDPQANTSRRLGFRWDPENPVATMSEAIKSGERGVAADAIVPCGWDHELAERIDLLPSRYDLENRMSEAGVLGAVQRLATVLDGADDDYDVVLIDCPPSLGHLTQMGLAAADHAVCVLQPEYDDVEGGQRFHNFITQHATVGLGNPHLRLRGVIVNNYDKRLGGHQFQLEGLPEAFADVPIWEPPIPAWSLVKDATDSASPLHAFESARARDLRDRLDTLANNVAELTLEEAA
jgi:chromosome partitioning protein